jgi:beta-galactosidase
MPILDLIGAKISFYDVLPAPYIGKVSSGGRDYDWFSWAEVLDPGPGTEVTARYSDQYYAGGAAAVTRALGRGTVTYIGVDTSDGQLEAQLIRDVFTRAGVAIDWLDENFLVDWRDGFWVATNFTDKNQIIPAPQSVKPLIGTREVPPAGVTVWR